MHTLQEFVRLARMGTGYRAMARMLRISPNTEREYRKALEAAGLLVGDPTELPELSELQAALERHKPPRLARQQVSTVEQWTPEVKAMLEHGAKPVAIFDRLRLEKKADFTGSLSAIKRLCRHLAGEQGPRPEDVAIRVETDPGQIAHAVVLVEARPFPRQHVGICLSDESEPAWSRPDVWSAASWWTRPVGATSYARAGPGQGSRCSPCMRSGVWALPPATAAGSKLATAPGVGWRRPRPTRRWFRCSWTPDRSQVLTVEI